MTKIYRDGKVHVRAEECARCLYGPARIVSGSRARQITRGTRGVVGSSFICHRNQTDGEPEAICAGWWDRFAADDPVFRMAHIAGCVERVQP